MIVHIITTISAFGDECDSVKALRIFDLLRNPRYSIIKFIDDQWQGSKFEQGGAS